jgi:prolyl-tRNA editing enzyme YbaK/EbsC (Cys-tRNA(Pro) deacylase)
LHFFALSVTTSLKIPGAVIPRRVFTRPGPSAAIGEKIGRANADFVRDATFFAIGGVPPVGHAWPPIVLIDESLLRFDNIWAAGTPNAVFRLTPTDLVALTGGRIVDVAKG